MNRYRAFYAEASNDPYRGTYLPLLNEYVTTANQPQDLRNKVYSTGNSGGSLGHFLLVRDPNLVGDGPGNIISYHRATRHDARIGRPSPFDGIGYSFLGDVNGNQPPMTVVIPDDYYNSASATQVPTSARIDQLLAADPNAPLLGPFAAGDADIEAVAVRRIMYAPPKYMLMAMDAPLTPREAWTRIRGAIVADGKEADCAELIDWLRVSLTRRGAGDQPRTTVDPPMAQALVDPRHANDFQSYRLNILHQDLPELSPNHVGTAATAISTNIADLVIETRQTRQEAEARRVQDANRTPNDFYGPALTRLLRFAQVGTESALQPIHTQLAKAKKQVLRKTLQAAVDVAIEQLGYRQDFQVTAALAKKTFDLEYHSNLENNFAVGINIFCLGQLEPESIDTQRRLIAQSDALSLNMAAPSLNDMATVLDPAGDVCIPRTLSQLRYSVEKYHALLLVLLGSSHSLVVKTKEFRTALVDREREIERATPRDLRHRYLILALIGRRFQLDTNYWLRQQAISGNNVPVPSLDDIFRDIALKRDWAPEFPDVYLLQPPPPAPPAPASAAGGDDASALTTPTGIGTNPGGGGRAIRSPAPSAGDENRSTIVRNTSCNSIFEPFRTLGHRISQIRERCRNKNVALPTNSRNHNMCLAYHIKGTCNERCASSEDHTAHTEEEDNTLLTWCQENYRLDE